MFNMIKIAFNKAKDKALALAVMAGGSMTLLPTDGHALAVTDFDTGSAATDIGLAVVAVLGIVIVVFGYKKVIGVFGRG